MSQDARQVLDQVAAELDRASRRDRPVTPAQLAEWAQALRLAARADEAAEQRRAAQAADARLYRR
jgi:hypothetical protein